MSYWSRASVDGEGLPPGVGGGVEVAVLVVGVAEIDRIWGNSGALCSIFELRLILVPRCWCWSASCPSTPSSTSRPWRSYTARTVTTGSPPTSIASREAAPDGRGVRRRPQGLLPRLTAEGTGKVRDDMR